MFQVCDCREIYFICHLYAEGGSGRRFNDGAIVNMNPELYNGVIAQSSFVDVVTTMLDDTIPLTTGEYDEWGKS